MLMDCACLCTLPQGAKETVCAATELLCHFVLPVFMAQVLSKRLAAAATGVPLGALVTPLPRGAPPPPLVRRPPVTCAACGAVLNPYCKVLLKLGIQVLGHSSGAPTPAARCC